MTMPDEAPPPSAPIPSSPVYSQINFVGNQVSTIVSPGVTNEMLLIGIAHLMAQLVVRVNTSSGGLMSDSYVLAGLSQKVSEITPQIIPQVNIR